jgi:hypothetical protein
MEATSRTGNEAELVSKTKKNSNNFTSSEGKTNYEQAASGVKHPGLCSVSNKCY